MPQITIPELEAIRTKVEARRSRRIRIMLALKEILTTITKANGYSIDICEVSFNTKSWKDVGEPQTPVIYILDDSTTITRRAGKTREYVWTLNLFGVVKGRTIEEFEEFLADIEECLEDNNHLAGQVNKVEINQIITDNQLFSGVTETHLFEMLIQAEFIRCLGDPR